MKHFKFTILATTTALATLLAHPGALAQRTPEAPGAPARPGFTLERLQAIAARSAPLLAIGRSEVDVASAGVLTARARPNPEIGLEPGRARARASDAATGSSTILSIGQPIENPWLRDARIRSAESGVDVARARAIAQRVDLASSIRSRYYEVIRIDEELGAYREDLQLTEQIRDRIQVRVRSGEAPRFDLVRAESEVEGARKNLTTARLRRLQALAELRGLVGPELPTDFDVEYDPVQQRRFDPAEYAALRARALDANPEIALARLQLEQSERQLSQERNSVVPGVTLRLAQERDPDVSITRIGAVVTVPLLNRREGPIAEARAQSERSRLLLEQRRFQVGSAFDALWQGYSAAQARVQSIEGGILERALSTLEIAEAAYRLGERGILEYLDAQRQFRIARNELIAARFELRTTRSELDRLLGNQ